MYLRGSGAGRFTVRKAATIITGKRRRNVVLQFRGQFRTDGFGGAPGARVDSFNLAGRNDEDA